MKKKIFGLFICMILLVTLTGCNNNKKINDDNSKTNEVTTAFKDKILSDNKIIEKDPTLNKGISDTEDSVGLYKSIVTNSGDATYYFRGDVKNNYVSFANKSWRIIRINEDGTVRLIAENFIDDEDSKYYQYNENRTADKGMYYSNSVIKTVLERWYKNNLSDYSDVIENGDYFCEQAKVRKNKLYDEGAITEALEYTPNFKCEKDSNGYGIVKSNIGLITYDETIFAGSYLSQHIEASNKTYLPHSTAHFHWTMSPIGKYLNDYYIWQVNASGEMGEQHATGKGVLHPVINIKGNIKVTGNGTENNPYGLK